MNPNLKVVTLTKRTLLTALKANTYWKHTHILIPKPKALWLANNTRISDDSICAVVCTDKEHIIAFVLTIPDTIVLKNGVKESIYWLREWWVHNDYQGSIVASFIFNKALKALQFKVLIESNAEKADAFFKTQFKTFTTKTRATLFLKIQKDVLASKFAFAKYLGLPIALANATLVRFINFRNYKKTQKALTAVTYEYMNSIDDATWTFIAPLLKSDFTLKTKDYVNWLINNHQYLQTPIRKRFPYQFSTTGFSDNIHNYSLTIFKQGKPIGFISYLYNMIEFNVRFFLVNDKAEYQTCLAALMEHALQHKPTYIITDDPFLTNEIKKHYRTLFTYKQQKTAKVHQRLDIDLNNVVLTDRDGRFH